MDEGVYLSNYNLVIIHYFCNINLEVVVVSKSVSDPAPVVKRFRWDHANVIMLYYNDIGEKLQTILRAINDFNLRNCDLQDFVVDRIYYDIVQVLTASANTFIPKHKHNFDKFWWTHELDIAKDKSISSNKLWKIAGKPHNDLNDESDKLAYKRVKDEMQRELNCCANDLHETLSDKNWDTDFLKCFRTKLGDNNATTCNGNGLADESSIAAKFAEHSANASKGNSEARCSQLEEAYTNFINAYIGETYLADYSVDVELIDKIISSLQKCKATGLDGLTAEHLQFCYPAINSC